MMPIPTFTWYGPTLESNPLVDSLDRAASVSFGLATVLELLEQNTFATENGDDPLLSITRAGSLLRFCIASAHLQADDAMRALDWAATHGHSH